MKILNVLIALSFLVSCNNKAKNTIENQSVEDVFVENLVEKQILTDEYAIEYEFAISIPSDYIIDELKAEDFVVYYITPADTATKLTFAGGIYFGNHPSSFEYNNCKKTIVKNKIFGKNTDWAVYDCDTTFSTQTLIKTKSKEHWCEYIHLFGNANSESELEKLFTVFRTFSKSERVGKK